MRDTTQGGVLHQVLSSGAHTSHAPRESTQNKPRRDRRKEIIQTGSSSMKAKQQKKINEIKSLVFLSQSHGGAVNLGPFPLGPGPFPWGPWPFPRSWATGALPCPHLCSKATRARLSSLFLRYLACKAYPLAPPGPLLPICVMCS